MSVTIPQSHAEWLESRRDGIGASDAAAVLGMSRWKRTCSSGRKRRGEEPRRTSGTSPRSITGKRRNSISADYSPWTIQNSG